MRLHPKTVVLKILFFHFLKSQIIITFTASAMTSKNCCLKNIVSSLSKINITFTVSAITSKNNDSSLSKINITFTASAITSNNCCLKKCFFFFHFLKSQIIITQQQQNPNYCPASAVTSKNIFSLTLLDSFQPFPKKQLT